MLEDDIIEPWDPNSYEPVYRATDKGRAWLEMICCTPMPRNAWVDPRSNKEVRAA
jgi:hypothetical protein